MGVGGGGRCEAVFVTMKIHFDDVFVTCTPYDVRGHKQFSLKMSREKNYILLSMLGKVCYMYIIYLVKQLDHENTPI